MKTIKNFKYVSVLFLVFSLNSNVFATEYLEDAKQSIAKGEDKVAIIQLRNHIKQQPKDAEARLLLGKLYLKNMQFELADKEISKAIRVQPDNKEIQLAYAEIQLIKGKYSSIVKTLKTAYSDAKDESHRLMLLAYAYLGQHKLKDAKTNFEQSNQLHENAQAYNGLARIAIDNKQYSIADKQLKKSLSFNQEDPLTLQLLARLYNLQGMHSEALKIYNKLIKKYPKKLTLYFNRIATFLALNQISDAQNDLNTAFKLYPDNIQLHYLQAQTSIRTKDYQQAQLSAQKVLSIKDKHMPSQLLLGVANFGLQNYNQAEKYLTQYLTFRPDNLYIQNMLANIYLIQKKPEQAILILEDIDEKQINKNPDILFTLGSAYLVAGEYEKGVEYLNKAEAILPQNKNIKTRLVEGLIKKGDVKKAIENLEALNQSESATKETQRLLVVVYIQQKQLGKAEQALKQMLKKNPDDPQLYNLQAVLEKIKNNPQQAIINYKKALTLQENFIPAYMGLAEIAEKNKQLQQAQNYYQQAIAYKKDYIQAYYALGRIYEKTGQRSKVEALLTQAFKNVPNVMSKVKVATTLSKIYARKKQPEKTMSLAKELMRHYPDNISVLSFYSGALMVNKQTDEAVNILKKIISRQPEDINHRLLLAQILSTRKKQEQEVLDLLDEVSRLQGYDNPTAQIIKAEFLIKNKQFVQADKLAETLITRFPDKAEPYQLKAQMHLLNKQYKEALDYFQKAYQIKKYNKLLFTIVDLMKVTGQGNKGIELLLSELENNKKNVGIYFKLANIYQQQKQVDKAVKYYQQMLAIQPDNVLALNNLAGIYQKQKNPKAIELARKAYTKEPDMVPIMDTYGYLLVQQGDYAQGIELLEKAVSKSPKAYEIIYHLAEAYALSGNKTKAKELLQPLQGDNIHFAKKAQAIKLYQSL